MEAGSHPNYPLTLPLRDSYYPLPSISKASRRSLSLAVSTDWHDIEQQCAVLDSVNMQISGLTLTFPDTDNSSSAAANTQPAYSISARLASPSPLSTNPSPRGHSMRSFSRAMSSSMKPQGYQDVEVKLGRRSLLPRQSLDTQATPSDLCSMTGHAVSGHVSQQARAGGRFLHRVGTEPKNVGSSRYRSTSSHTDMEHQRVDLYQAAQLMRNYAADHLTSGEVNLQAASLDRTPLHQAGFQPMPPAEGPSLSRYSSSSLASTSSIDSFGTEQSLFNAVVPYSPSTPQSIEDAVPLHSGQLFSGSLHAQRSLDKSFMHPLSGPKLGKSSRSFQELGCGGTEAWDSFLIPSAARKAPGTSRQSIEVANKLRLQVDLLPFDASQHEQCCSAAANGGREPSLARRNREQRRCREERKADLLREVENEKAKMLFLAGDPVVTPFGRAGDPLLKRRGKLV